jgi:hypothetical protein
VVMRLWDDFGDWTEQARVGLAFLCFMGEWRLKDSG